MKKSISSTDYSILQSPVLVGDGPEFAPHFFDAPVRLIITVTALYTIPNILLLGLFHIAVSVGLGYGSTHFSIFFLHVLALGFITPPGRDQSVRLEQGNRRTRGERGNTCNLILHHGVFTAVIIFLFSARVKALILEANTCRSF